MVIKFTSRRAGSCLLKVSVTGGQYYSEWVPLTQRVATGKLRPLCVFGGELVTNAVQQLNVALLRILLQRGNEGPRHGTSCLRSNRGIGPVDKSC